MINLGYEDPEWRDYWGMNEDDPYDPFAGSTNYEQEDYQDEDID